MNTIVVTITVPDGVQVDVRQETSGPPPAAVAQPAPSGTPVCPTHNGSRFVPAGTSKSTGKAYTAFFSCTERACGWRANA